MEDARHKPKRKSTTTTTSASQLSPADRAALQKALGNDPSNTRHAIGVPDDYTVRHEHTWDYGPSGSGPLEFGDKPGHVVSRQPARYFTGDESKYGSRSPEEIAQLQQALVDGGLLDPDLVAWGVADPNTTAAYKELLHESNQTGQTWQSTIMNRLQAAADGRISIKGASKKQPVPRTISLTNETDIKAVAEKSSASLLGRTLQPDEITPFVAAYHEKEAAAQNQAFDQQYGKDGLGGTGGTAVQAPDLGAFVNDEIKAKYQNEVTGQQVGQNGLAFLKMLSQGAGGGGLSGYQT